MHLKKELQKRRSHFGFVFFVWDFQPALVADILDDGF